MSEEEKPKKGGFLKWSGIGCGGLLLLIIIMGGCIALVSQGGDDDSGDTAEDSTESSEEEGSNEETATEETDSGEQEESSSENNEESAEDTEEVIEEETETEQENLSVGDTVEMDGVTVTIDDAYYTDERNEVTDVEADSVMILDISFENNTGEDYSPAMDFEVYADGSKAEEYPIGDIVLDSVSDGRSSSGSLAYGIVGEPDEIEVEFSPLFSFSGEKAIFNVTP